MKTSAMKKDNSNGTTPHPTHPTPCIPFTLANSMDSRSFASIHPNLRQLLEGDRVSFDPSPIKAENTQLTIRYFPDYLRFILDTLRMHIHPKPNLTTTILACLEHSLNYLNKHKDIRRLEVLLNRFIVAGATAEDLDEHTFYRLKVESFTLGFESKEGKRVSILMLSPMDKLLGIVASLLKLSKYQTAVLCCMLAVSELEGIEGIHPDHVEEASRNRKRFFRRLQMAIGFVETCLRNFGLSTEGGQEEAGESPEGPEDDFEGSVDSDV